MWDGGQKMQKAFPSTSSRGNAPQTWLSLDKLRLSPKTKRLSGGHLEVVAARREGVAHGGCHVGLRDGRTSSPLLAPDPDWENSPHFSLREKSLHLGLKLPQHFLGLQDEIRHLLPSQVEGVGVSEDVAEFHVPAEVVARLKGDDGRPGAEGP